MVHDTSRKLNRSRGRVITGVSVKSKRRLDAAWKNKEEETEVEEEEEEKEEKEKQKREGKKKEEKRERPELLRCSRPSFFDPPNALRPPMM